MLRVENVQYQVGKKNILHGISTAFERNRFHVILGPNGSGKSTFLKIFSGELRPQQGSILYDDADVFQLDKTLLARRRAVMSQQPELQFPLTVAEIVMMGRYPHFTFKPSQKDHEICLQAMRKMEVEELYDRDYLTLSGGEKQRVHFARVMTQIWGSDAQGKYLFLDEAVSHLDLKHQHQVLRISKELCDQNVTVIAILHDVNLALAYSDRMLLMKNGSIAYEIRSAKDLTREIIRDVFDVNAEILNAPELKNPVVIF